MGFTHGMAHIWYGVQQPDMLRGQYRGVTFRPLTTFVGSLDWCVSGSSMEHANL